MVIRRLLTILMAFGVFLSPIATLGFKKNSSEHVRQAALNITQKTTEQSNNCAHLILEESHKAGQGVSLTEDGPAGILSELIALKKDNIFVSTQIWNKFCNYHRALINRDPLLRTIHIENWTIYSTPSGLIYLSPHAKTLDSLGKIFETKNWQKISMPHLKPVHNKTLDLDLFKSLFKKNEKIPWCFFVGGHGSPTSQLPNGDLLDKYSGKWISVNQMQRYHETYIAGLESSQFKKVLSFLGHELNTKQIVLLSCFAYPERVFKLLDTSKLPYDLITAVPGHETASTSRKTYYSPWNETHVKTEPLIHVLGMTSNYENIKNILFTQAISSRPAIVKAGEHYHTMQYKNA